MSYGYQLGFSSRDMAVETGSGKPDVESPEVGKPDGRARRGEDRARHPSGHRRSPESASFAPRCGQRRLGGSI